VWEWISSLPIEIVGSVYERGWVINPIGECESEFLINTVESDAFTVERKLPIENYQIQ
jgi:hypothetical protein